MDKLLFKIGSSVPATQSVINLDSGILEGTQS
jgi:hypothetical protein